MSKLPSSPSAECSVTGDIHFTTFDGRRYTFPATCQYILAKSRSSGTFTVTLQNAPCGLVRLGGSPSSNRPPTVTERHPGAPQSSSGSSHDSAACCPCYGDPELVPETVRA